MSRGARRWADVEHVATHLGVSPSTVRRHIAAGTLRAYRLGNRTIRLDLNEVDRDMRAIPPVPVRPPAPRARKRRDIVAILDALDI